MRVSSLKRPQLDENLHIVDRVEPFDVKSKAIEQAGKIFDAEMIDPPEGRPIEVACELGCAITQDEFAVAAPQMREKSIDVDDVFEKAEHDDYVGLPCGRFRELTRIQVADDCGRVARHQIARLIRAIGRQQAAQRHPAAAEIEHAAAGGDEIGGKFCAPVPRRLERARIRPALDVGPNLKGEIASDRHAHARNRSIPLERFSPLLSTPGIQFISLQRELRGNDAAVLDRNPQVTNVVAEFEDFADTAAVISLLDLVISVDTSVAHLAGTLGKPVWILLPFAPDFRWMLERDDSPWYPSAQLFRQPGPGDWDTVIKRICAGPCRII
jgi:hypothetical protein